MVHRPTAREPAYYFDVFFLYIIQVDFRHRVLVFAHNDGIVVPPKHKAIFLQVFEDVFVSGNVEVGVGGVVVDTEHVFFVKISLSATSGMPHENFILGLATGWDMLFGRVG